MRLFDEQGYEATTVEQIALAAEISTATFYRYYCDKEAVVLRDDSRALVEEVLAGRPADEPLADTIRALFERVAVEMENDRQAMIVRLRLMCGVPGLRARQWASRQDMIDLMASLVAPRVGTVADDHDLRLAITVALAAESETVLHWARIGGTEPLAALLGRALATITPLFAPWSGEAAL